MTPALVQVGLDRSRATVELLGEAHRQLDGRGFLGVGEGYRTVALLTCHRVEVYFEALPVPRCVELFLDWLCLPAERRAVVLPHLAVRVGEAAARHLFRVAAGLESAVLGEDQVQGQVRTAYRRACAERTAGGLLHRTFHAAFRAGKRVRSETELGGGGRSLAGCGVNVLARTLGGLEGASVLVLGAGEMGTLAARRLRQRGVGRLLLANRTWERAVALGQEVGGEALPWDWRHRVLAEVAGVVCATGAHEGVLDGAWVAQASVEGALRCVIDLAVPPSVTRHGPWPPSLVVLDVDALGRDLADGEARRHAAVVAAESIVEDVVREWLAGLGRGEAWRVRQTVGRRDVLVG